MFDLLSKFLHGATAQFQTKDPFLDSMVQWLGKLQESAFTKWRSVAASGIRCGGKMLYRNVGALPCPHPAISACASCRKPTCIGHSFVSMDGSAVCGTCVGLFVSAARDGKFPGVDKNQESAGNDPSHGHSPTPNSEELRVKHLKNLGLSSGATWGEISSAFRAISKKKHPDKAAPSRRAAAEAKYKTITESFEWLNANTQGR